MTISNSAILHGRTVDDCCLIGMGAMVLEEFNVPEKMLIAGVPAKIKRSLTEEEKQLLHRSAANYVR